MPPVADVAAKVRSLEASIASAQTDITNLQRQIQLVPQLLRARRDREVKRVWTPQYTGTITVVDTDERPLDSYKLGDQVAFTGFNSALDHVVARIVGISRTPFNATLSLSFVLPTANRRLTEIEADNRNRGVLRA